MPQPVDLQSLSSPCGAISQRPACAVQIAVIVSEWARIEDSLALMFSAAMGTHSVLPEGGNQVSRNWVALVTMNELDSIRMRLRIIEKTLIPLHAGLEPRWKVLEKELRARAKERNTVAHTCWSLSDKYPDDVIAPDEQGRRVRWTEKDFLDIRERIYQANGRVLEFLNDVLAAQRVGHQSRHVHGPLLPPSASVKFASP